MQDVPAGGHATGNLRCVVSGVRFVTCGAPPWTCRGFPHPDDQPSASRPGAFFIRTGTSELAKLNPVQLGSGGVEAYSRLAKIDTRAWLVLR